MRRPRGRRCSPGARGPLPGVAAAPAARSPTRCPTTGARRSSRAAPSSGCSCSSRGRALGELAARGRWGRRRSARTSTSLKREASRRCVGAGGARRRAARRRRVLPRLERLRRHRPHAATSPQLQLAQRAVRTGAPRVPGDAASRSPSPGPPIEPARPRAGSRRSPCSTPGVDVRALDGHADPGYDAVDRDRDPAPGPGPARRDAQGDERDRARRRPRRRRRARDADPRRLAARHRRRRRGAADDGPDHRRPRARRGPQRRPRHLRPRRRSRSWVSTRPTRASPDARGPGRRGRGGPRHAHRSRPRATRAPRRPAAAPSARRPPRPRRSRSARSPARSPRPAPTLDAAASGTSTPPCSPARRRKDGHDGRPGRGHRPRRPRQRRSPRIRGKVVIVRAGANPAAQAAAAAAVGAAAVLIAQPERAPLPVDARRPRRRARDRRHRGRRQGRARSSSPAPSVSFGAPKRGPAGETAPARNASTVHRPGPVRRRPAQARPRGARQRARPARRRRRRGRHARSPPRASPSPPPSSPAPRPELSPQQLRAALIAAGDPADLPPDRAGAGRVSAPASGDHRRPADRRSRARSTRSASTSTPRLDAGHLRATGGATAARHRSRCVPGTPTAVTVRLPKPRHRPPGGSRRSTAARSSRASRGSIRPDTVEPSPSAPLKVDRGGRRVRFTLGAFKRGAETQVQVAETARSSTSSTRSGNVRAQPHLPGRRARADARRVRLHAPARTRSRAGYAFRARAWAPRPAAADRPSSQRRR